MDAERIVRQMTLKDKIRLCSGAGFWKTKKMPKYGIPSVFLCDGPHGLRKQEKFTDMLGLNSSRPATCFPAAVTTADSWNEELLYEIGAAIAEEALDQNVHIVLGPGCNLKRNPLCGRNFEYFSEDPFLSGKLAAGFIRGVEDNGIVASLKHFAVNSQETDRFTSDGIIDERTLREMYLTAFEISVKEGKPSTVMCAYPKLNGIHLSDHKKLLSDILREEWGFEGAVITDWGAMNDRIEAFRAGCDMNMPGGSGYMEKDARKAVQKGILDQKYIDASAKRILNLVFKADGNSNPDVCADYEAHHALAVSAASQGGVLLKNEGKLLPLREDSLIAVIGDMAENMRFQGAGSSHITPTKTETPVSFFKNHVFARGYDENGSTDEEKIAEACKKAKSAECAVVFAGLAQSSESEGFDRRDMKLSDGQNRLIRAVIDANPATVVVLLCGSPVECSWADDARAILYMGLPGQGGAEAVYRLLTGKENPSGRLSETWPVSYYDVPSSDTYAKQRDAYYTEGIYVGYRYYDKAGISVRWPFGHGLSYTEFAYSDLRCEGNSVCVRVRNTGARAGYETAIFYVSPPEGGLHRPVREMKGFRKVFLEPGEEKEIVFSLDERSFSVYDGGWKIPKGRYTLSVGGLCVYKDQEGEEVPAPEWQRGSFYETCAGKPRMDEFEKMLGRKIVSCKSTKGTYTMDNTPLEMSETSRLMRFFCRVVSCFIRVYFGRGRKTAEYDMMLASSIGAPLRSLQISGGIRGGLMKGMLEIANGHVIKGIGKMIFG